MQTMVKVITINILFDLTEWQQRRDLLVRGLAAEQADLIALQEVKPYSLSLRSFWHDG